VDPVTTKSLPSYEEVAKQLNVSVAAVKTLIHRLRQRNTAIVREEIMRTVSDAADLEAESRELCQALIAAEGHILPVKAVNADSAVSLEARSTTSPYSSVS
jgi:hypothetical protein